MKDDKNRIKIIRPALLGLLLCFLGILAYRSHRDTTRAKEYEASRAKIIREANQRNQVSSAPLVYAEKGVLVPLRALDQFSVKVAESAEWSQDLLTNVLLPAQFKPSNIPDLRRRADLLGARIKQLEAHAVAVRALKIPEELKALYKSDLESYATVLKLLRLRHQHVLEVCKTGALLSSAEVDKFNDSWVKLNRDREAHLSKQAEHRKALLQRYTGDAKYMTGSEYFDAHHRSVARGMLTLLDSKYQVGRSLWSLRQVQEKNLAALEVMEPPYLLEPLTQARIRYAQRTVDFSQELMRSEPKTEKELDERTEALADVVQDVKQQTYLFKLYR